MVDRLLGVSVFFREISGRDEENTTEPGPTATGPTVEA